jgi:hypothetical protein
MNNTEIRELLKLMCDYGNYLNKHPEQTAEQQERLISVMADLRIMYKLQELVGEFSGEK